MLGGAGNDVFLLATSYSYLNGDHTVDGGDGVDVVDMTYSIDPILVTASEGLNGPVVHIVAGSASVSAQSVEKIVGSTRGDVFYGGGTGIEFDGGDGNDIFYLKSGDVGVGGAGSDAFWLEPGAKAIGGGNNIGDVDSFHFVVPDDWTSITSDSIQTLAGGKVYLDWNGVELQLPIPIGDYYNPNPHWELSRIGNVDQYILTSPTTQSVTLLNDNGVQAVSIQAGSVMGSWSYPYFAPYGQYGIDIQKVLTAVDGGIYGAEAPLVTGMTDVADAKGSFYLSQNLISGSHFGYVTVPIPTMMSIVAAGGHYGPGSELFGPVDVNGAASADTSINVGSDVAGIAVFGGAGYHTASGSYDAGSQNEDITTGAGGDLIITGTGSGLEIASAGEGDDVIVGRGYNQLLSGESGNDVIIPGPGHSIVSGGAGFDMLSYSGLSGVNVTMHDGTGSVSKGAYSDSVSGIEVVIGTGGTDVFTGGGRGTMFVGNGGGDLFNLSGIAVAAGNSGEDDFRVSAGSKVLLFNVDGSDVISVGGLVITGTKISASDTKENIQPDNSYDWIEHQTLTGSIGSGEVDTLLLHWNGSDGTYTTPIQTLGSGYPADFVKLVAGPDVSELVVNQGGIETDLFIANYRDGMAGIHSDALTRYPYANSVGMYVSSDSHPEMDSTFGWTAAGTEQLHLTNHQVTDFFGF